MKDFNKFLDSEEHEDQTIKEQEGQTQKKKKLTYKESLCMDDEFKKWMSMSDEIMGYNDDGSKKPIDTGFDFGSDDFTSNIQKQANEIREKVLTEQMPTAIGGLASTPGTSGAALGQTTAPNVNVNVPLPQASGTSAYGEKPVTMTPQQTRQQQEMEKTKVQREADLKRIRANRQVMSALQTNPTLKPLFDLINKVQ